ncbi:MAG TPA: SDR family oxidoreductase [bacterium]|nr:SDR family oxidoreductase [bacterium]
MPSVLISGGTRGIGLALCRSFLKAGWHLATCYHQDEASAEAARVELCQWAPNFLLSKADVTQEEAMAQWVQEAHQRFGSLDCAIHNAGSTLNARILNVEEADWDATLDVHLKGAFHLAKAALRPMLKQKNGHFLFVSSIVATTGNIGQGSYTAAKAGVSGFARSLAQEYGSKNIRANVVCPGFHKTRIADNLSPEAEQAIKDKHLLGKTADLGEVTQFVTWLAGTKNISGQVFNLDSRLPGWL